MALSKAPAERRNEARGGDRRSVSRSVEVADERRPGRGVGLGVEPTKYSPGSVTRPESDSRALQRLDRQRCTQRCIAR